ncbi:MAG: pentapeptide repeat-containing protein, partial [Snowella sp.]|nr:pentapeptide repeat-containing protein [Snowella sp.]
LQRAITEPAKKANLELEAGLVEQMLRDGGNQPGSLPLVQDTLTELWQKRVDNSLKLSVYVKLGGISGTLNKRATAFYNALSAAEKETVKYIFLALTQLGEGTEDTRRRVLKQDLITVKYPEEVIDLMIQKLANERLIVTDKPGETTDKNMAIEVAHEALIREWELLRQWLDQDRANLLQQRKIEGLAQDWENSGRKSAYLLVGFRLKEARKFQKEQALQYPLKKLGSDFIAKSVGQQRQNWLKFGVIPLIGVSIITFFGIRTYIVQSSWKIVQETQGEKYDLRRINALEDLLWWRESLEGTSFQKTNLYQIQLPNVNLTLADLNSTNLIGTDLERASLQATNLKYASLNYADLERASLNYANLTRADLTSANLKYASLNYANLTRAFLSGANLTSANLSSANLNSVFLSSANLSSANLNNANLSSASLDSTILIEAENLTNTQIKSACFWDKAIYKRQQKLAWWITDEKANQDFIAQLKQDKASDPKVKPECRMWEK